MARLYGMFETLWKEQAGAVTVDWVVVTALVVGIAAFGAATIGEAVVTMGGFIVEDITDS